MKCSVGLKNALDRAKTMAQASRFDLQPACLLAAILEEPALVAQLFVELGLKHETLLDNLYVYIESVYKTAAVQPAGTVAKILEDAKSYANGMNLTVIDSLHVFSSIVRNSDGLFKSFLADNQITWAAIEPHVLTVYNTARSAGLFGNKRTYPGAE